MVSSSNPIWRFIIGIDQALNPLILGGSEDVTLSAQVAYNEILAGKDVWLRKTLDILFRPFEDKHCYRSLFGEIDEFPQDKQTLLDFLRTQGVE